MLKENKKNKTFRAELPTLINARVNDYLDLITKNNYQTSLRQLDFLSIDSLLVEGNRSTAVIFPNQFLRLEPRKKYLQIALNSNLDEAREIIKQLPLSEKIVIEVGTPLIKIHGLQAVQEIRNIVPSAYLVADAKIADLAEREVEALAATGANAVTCLGVAPVETIEGFINTCEKYKIDSMLDMMNVDSAITILKKLKKLPVAVILHRGVDETEFSKEKTIPYYQIKQIKGNFNLIVSVAGGDTLKEIQSAFFNDADIVVVWKNFMQSGANISEVAKRFLQEIR